jgi:hypothetical protein
VISLFNNEMMQGNRIRLAVQPKPRFCFQLASIMVATLLLGLAVGSRGGITQREILQPRTEIAGVQTDSAYGNDIHLQNAGLSQILYYTNFQQTLTTPFAIFLSVEAGMTIYIAPDMPAYDTTPTHEQVLHFNWDDALLTSLVSRGIMAQPDSVVVDEHNGHLLVADSLLDPTIVFGNVSMTLPVFKPRQILSIAEITPGPDGKYVPDRLAKMIAIGEEVGTFLDTFGGNASSESGTIAVSRDNVTFIGDDFDNTIGTNRRHGVTGNIRMPADKIGDSQIATGSFNSIGGLAALDVPSYLADRMSA